MNPARVEQDLLGAADRDEEYTWHTAVVACLLGHPIFRVAGFLGIGVAAALLIGGLGPIGLALLFVATVVLAAQYEDTLNNACKRGSP